MRKRLLLPYFFAAFFVLCVATNAQTPEFTYQGRLVDGSLPASGTYEMRFRLFDAESGGTPQPPATPITLDFTIAGGNPVTVTNGVFTVKLDFSVNAFPGAARFLEISVRRTASDPFTMLNPRQPITSAPHNIRSLTSGSSDGLSVACVLCVTDAQILSVDGAKITGTVANSTTAVNVSGVVPIANGGTGSSTKNFVDLSTNQSIVGNKNFVQTATFSGANIFSLNSSGSATFNGNIAFNNANPITVSGTITADGSIRAEQFTGSGEGLTNVPGTLIWQTVSGQAQQAQRNTGYLLTNDAQVTITLPTDIIIGDTVRVSGTGASGWKIAQNDGQSIIGANIGLSGLNWIPRESNRFWQHIAISADGSKLAATVTNGQIYTSDDFGVTWTPRETNRWWAGIAMSADGSKLAAVVRDGQIYTSTDSGMNWTPRESNRVWSALASSSDGNKLVAVVGAGTIAFGQIYTSTDAGITWTPRESNRSWISVASSADGTNLVAAVDGGQIYTSTDSGITWTPRANNLSWVSVASSAAGNKLAAVVNGQIWLSSNSGITWTPGEPTGSNTNDVTMSADGVRIVVVAEGGKIYISTDSGVTWTLKENNRLWRSVASSADGSKLAALVSGGQIYTSSSSTTLGPAGFITGGQFSAIELQYIGNGKFLPLSHSGAILGF